MNRTSTAAVAGVLALGIAAPGMVEGADQMAMARGALSMASESRDEIYRETLNVAERFKAVWKQQPDNRAALERYLAAARDQIEALCGEQGAAAPPVTPGDPRSRPATDVAEVAPPGGPVRPSQEASDEADVERRMEAIEEFYGVDVSGGVRPSLAGVEEGWIERQCREARARLDEVEQALSATPRDAAALDRALDQMHVGLVRMGSPPPQSPPVLPRAPQRDSG